MGKLRQQRGGRTGSLSPLTFVVAALLGALLALGPVASLAQESGGGSGTEPSPDGGGIGVPPGDTTTSESTSTTESTAPTIRPTTTVRPRLRPRPRARPRPRPGPTTTAPVSAPTPVAPGTPSSAAGGEEGGFQSSGSAPLGTSVSFITPFPVVRIAGSLTRRGTRIRLLSVRAPAGTAVAARCRGRGCPRALARKAVSLRVTRGGAPLRLRAMQRTFRAGIQLRILVTRPGLYGKYTRFRIRRGKAPTRTDMCLPPTAPGRPSRCPR